MEEIWRDIPYLPGYKISSFGRLLSCEKTIVKKSISYNIKEKVLKCYKSKNGYIVFGFRGKLRYLHRIVIEVFVSEIKEGFEVDHIDGDRTNNSLSNLRIVNRKQNVENTIRLGRMRKGESAPWSKLKEVDIINIRKDPRTHREISMDYNVSRQTIGEIKNRIIWKHLK